MAGFVKRFHGMIFQTLKTACKTNMRRRYLQVLL